MAVSPFLTYLGLPGLLDSVLLADPFHALFLLSLVPIPQDGLSRRLGDCKLRLLGRRALQRLFLDHILIDPIDMAVLFGRISRPSIFG